MINYIVIFILTILFLFVLFFATQKQHLGKSPINKQLFILGKFSMFISWMFLFFKALFPGFFQIISAIYLEGIAVSLLLLSIIIVSMAFLKLGKSTKFGLPDKESTLITRGIYSISRNPMYLAFAMICIASSLFNPNIINIVFSIIGIAIHHKIILAEEKFLKASCSQEWNKYKNRTRRYI